MQFTKEQLTEKAVEQIKLVKTLELSHDAAEHAAMCTALFEIALASLEAEPVGYYRKGSDGFYFASPTEQRPGTIPLYAAPPAPVVPDERASFNAWNNDTDCPLAGLTVKQAAWLAWLKRSGTIKSFGNDEELEPVSNRDELPATQQQQNAQQNIPNNIPGGLIEAVNDLLNNDGSRGRYSAIGCGNAREKIELWLSQRQKWESQRDKNISAGNSPVIPDGLFTGLFNSARALLDALYEFGPDEVAISEHVQNLEDALRNAAAPQQEVK